MSRFAGATPRSQNLFMLPESVKQLVPQGSLRHPCSEIANSNTLLGCGNKMIHALKIRHNFDNPLPIVISFRKEGRALAFNYSILEEGFQGGISPPPFSL